MSASNSFSAHALITTSFKFHWNSVAWVPKKPVPVNSGPSAAVALFAPKNHLREYRKNTTRFIFRLN